MTDTSVADVDLVARAQAGDVDAYAELVERYQAFAVGLAAVVTRQPADAEDIAQEAFFKAYHALDRFRPGASFRPWLARIVVNEARNTLAGSQRRKVLHDRFAADAARTESEASAEEAAVANEQRAALLAVLDAQREDDRAVLMYRYVFDLSEAEMAQALACSNGTVKSRLSRALARLRTDMRKVAPLLAVSPNLGDLLRQSMSAGAGPQLTEPARDLVAGVLHRIAVGGVPGAAGSAGGAGRPTVQQAVAAAAGGVVVAALAATGFLLSTSQKPSPPPAPLAAVVASPVPVSVSSPPPLPSPTLARVAAAVASATPPPNVVVVYGDDLTDEQHQEVSAILAPAGPSRSIDVSRDELQSALRAAGLSVDGSERAISSTAVTCLNPGDGLSVRTENVTEIPAAAFANALVAAGMTDASVVVAAPPSTPMTGETAIVGVLKAYPLCNPQQPLEPTRLRIAYAQLHATADIAEQTGAWDRAAAIMLRSAQVAIKTPGADEATLGAAVDAASAAEGVTLDASRRSEAIAVLTDLTGLEQGSYAQGYTIQQASANQVRVVPVATGTP